LELRQTHLYLLRLAFELTSNGCKAYSHVLHCPELTNLILFLCFREVQAEALCHCPEFHLLLLSLKQNPSMSSFLGLMPPFR